MKARHISELVLVGLLVLINSGCRFGKKEVVFVTNTSIGVDFDAKTPTMSIGYNRFEGVLQPQFEQGQVLPVLSSINSQAGLRAFGSGHSFAVGAPAVIFGEMGTKNGDYFVEDDPQRESLRPGVISYAPISADNKILNIRPDSILTELGGSEQARDQRRRVVFTTSTKLALDVEFSAGEGGAPTAINLGYKRKEFAYAPLLDREVSFIDPNDSSKTIKAYVVSAPALLATAGAKSNIINLQNSSGGAGIEVSQTFSTGAAATYLASHTGVRNVLGPTLIENFETAEQLQARVDRVETDRENQKALVKSLNESFAKLSKSDQFDVFKKARDEYKLFNGAEAANSVTADTANLPAEFEKFLVDMPGNADQAKNLKALSDYVKTKPQS